MEMIRGKKTFKTVVADSHNLFRRGLATLIASESDMEVVGEASTAAQALALVNSPGRDAQEAAVDILVPSADILVMDLRLVLDDPEAVNPLRVASQSVALLLLAPVEGPECLELTMACGARAYMLKTTAPAQLVAGIRKATLREEIDSNGLSRQAPDLQALAKSERGYTRTSPLTSREQEVMTLLAEGRTVREVASELSLSIKTIEAHKLNLMRKLDIHNRASLVEYAVRARLVSPQPVGK